MKNNPQKAGVITNTAKDKDMSKTAVICALLKKHGITPVVPEGGETPSDAFFACCDFILTLGGDGTILSIAEKAAQAGVPVMGVNIGNLGYLTDCAFEDAEASVVNLTKGAYQTEKRMMLDVTVNGRTESCLNDVCVTRGATAKIIRYNLYINGNFVDCYSADGIIVSTPTGSTAYNLSAGGPILMPHSEMFAITPVCPHMLTARPIVAESGAEIKIVIGDARTEAVTTLDGRESAVLLPGDTVYVKKAGIHTDIIKTNTLNFYDILRKKLI